MFVSNIRQWGDHILNYTPTEGSSTKLFCRSGLISRSYASLCDAISIKTVDIQTLSPIFSLL